MYGVLSNNYGTPADSRLISYLVETVPNSHVPLLYNESNVKFCSRQGTVFFGAVSNAPPFIKGDASSALGFLL